MVTVPPLPFAIKSPLPMVTTVVNFEALLPMTRFPMSVKFPSVRSTTLPAAIVNVTPAGI